MRIVMANSEWRMTNGESRLVRCVLLITNCSLLVTFITACTVVRLTRPVVKIGLVGPFEGQYRYVGYDAIYAARLALREASAAGGVGGYSVELVAYDDRGTVAGARMAARNLAQDPEVVAVIGHFRGETTEAARAIYDQAGLPLVVAGTVEGESGGEADLLCPLLDYLGGALAVRRVGWMSFAEAVPAPVCAESPSVTASEGIPPPPDVDAVLLTLDPVAAGETLVALREAGWEGIVAGGPTLGSPLFARVAGEAAAGVVFASPYRWPEDESDESRDADFSAAYQSLGPHVPRPGPFALTTYQAAQALLAAIETANHRGEKPTRQTLAPYLHRPSTTTVYLYRWASSGTPELIGP
jgi:ABC-type branched-subunit amino acid transport system substrate-binding protein